MQLTLVSVEASADVYLLTADNNYSLPCKNNCTFNALYYTMSETFILEF